MRTLVVGGGAVGQVLGSHMASTGAPVHLMVKPGREQGAADGVALTRLRRLGSPSRTNFRPAGVVSSVGQAGDAEWDLVLLCVSSSALRGPWLAELAAVIGPASVVCIGQGPTDAATMYSTFGDDRALFLVPSLLAWTGRLHDDAGGSDVSYWLPPGARQLVGGDNVRADALVAALRSGGLGARFEADAAYTGAHIAARTTPFVAALEASDWSFAALGRGSLADVARAAQQEAQAAIAAARDRTIRPARAPGRRTTQLVLALLRRSVPFDLERYVAKHFAKTSAQTQLMLDEWTELGRQHELPVRALEELSQLRMHGPTHSTQ